MTKNRISRNIPPIGKELVGYKGKDLIDKLGSDTIKDLVANILCGTNIRSLTEALTRKRLALCNASLLVTFLNASNTIADFSDNISKLVSEELKRDKLTKEEKSYLLWIVGLTGKSVQNVLRSSEEELTIYLNELEIALKESAEQSKKIFGDLTGEIKIKDGQGEKLSWPVLTQIFMAIGAQTLAIRGSEKSMYGKLFEKFILGSLLTVLGFKLSNNKITKRSKKIFWLSERNQKRESDATLLYKPGMGVRFDIGFIGPGNTEISLDKVSRFETEMKLGRQTHYMSTLIIVDRIGEGSRIVELAEQINANIVQMSMTFWVKEVAKILNRKLGFKHKILSMSDKDTIDFIKDEMQKVDLRLFLNTE